MFLVSYGTYLSIISDKERKKTPPVWKIESISNKQNLLGTCFPLIFFS